MFLILMNILGSTAQALFLQGFFIGFVIKKHWSKRASGTRVSAEGFKVWDISL